jgi:hypothetical protein
MSAIFEVNARSPCHDTLIHTIGPKQITKCQLPVLITISQTQSALSGGCPKGFPGPKTHRPQPSPPHGERSQTRGVHKPYRFTSTFSRSCLTTEQATVPAWPARVLSCRSSTVFARLRTMSVATSRDEVSQMLCSGDLCPGSCNVQTLESAECNGDTPRQVVRPICTCTKEVCSSLI